MRPMIEHMFGCDKFGAEFPSAAQRSISRNSLRNVQLIISCADPSIRYSVTRRAGPPGQGRPKLAAMPCSADS
jgi:hypothetical protein